MLCDCIVLLVPIVAVGVGGYLLQTSHAPEGFPDRLVVTQAQLNPGNSSIYDPSAFPSQWWAVDNNDTAYHLTNKARVAYFDKHLKAHPKANPTRAKQILDIGCGTGAVSSKLAARGYSVTGVDISTEYLQVAHDYATENGLPVKYYEADIYSLPFASGWADGVVLGDVLHHLEDIPRALAEAARMVKPGGAIVVSTIARSPASFQLHRLLARYVTGYPAAHNDWRMWVQAGELEEAVAAAGLELLPHRLMGLLPSLRPHSLRRALDGDDDYRGILGEFWGVSTVGLLNRLLASFGPYLAVAVKPPRAALPEDGFTFFPAGSHSADGTVIELSEEEILANAVSYEDTQKDSGTQSKKKKKKSGKKKTAEPSA